MDRQKKPTDLTTALNQSSDPYPKLYFYRRIVQAKLFIDQHYAENIELFCIADEACYSKFHFIRKFKEIYRKTPHQYLISVRIENAMKLLASGIPVTAVCDAVGFEELSSFSRSFKRIIGINPSDYLSKQQVLKKQITDSPLTVIPHCFAYQYGWLEK
ncbi:MAG: helix-turn-helix transcriptional regulator [Bacteroidota bacterium]|nr:helix-turn-helix transcriptional regulator [Bacteroidota bacterium]